MRSCSFLFLSCSENTIPDILRQSHPFGVGGIKHPNPGLKPGARHKPEGKGEASRPHPPRCRGGVHAPHLPA
jgi:hypothetical protein